MSESSFPKSLDFSPDPLAISARAYESVCVPESSSSAREGNIVRIRIPSGRAGTYLNCAKSFLAFSVTNTSQIPGYDANSSLRDSKAATFAQLYIDGSAYALFQQMEIYNSSNLLESITNYNLLMNIFMDLQISMGSRLTSGTILGMGASGITDMLYKKIEGGGQLPTWSQQGTKLNLYPTGNAVVAGPEFRNIPAGIPNAMTGLNIISSQGAAAAIPAPSADPADKGRAKGNVTIYVPNGVGTDYINDNIIFAPYGESYRGALMGRNNGIQFLNESEDVIAEDTLLAKDYFSSLMPPILAGENQRNIIDAYNNAKSMGGANVNGWISRLGPVIPYGQKMRFCLPLVSGVLGTLSCKLFPLNALNSDLLLQLTLASNNTVACNNYIPNHYNTTVAETNPNIPATHAFTGASIDSTIFIPSYTMSEIEYHANIVEISANAQQMIDIATNGQYIIPSSSYRNYSATAQSGQTNNEFQVPARFTSLKSLIGCQRSTGSLNQACRFSLTSRIKNYMTRIQYRVGSLLVPPQPMRMENMSVGGPYSNGGNASEVFCHLLESIGQSASDLDLEVGLDANIFGANNDLDYQVFFNATNSNYKQESQAEYNLVRASTQTNVWDRTSDDGTGGGQTDQLRANRLAEGSRAGFTWGIDLESFSNSNCLGPLQSGTNCLGLNIMCRLYNDSLTTQTGETIHPERQIVGVTIDHFAHFDQVLVISGGVCSVRF